MSSHQVQVAYFLSRPAGARREILPADGGAGAVVRCKTAPTIDGIRRADAAMTTNIEAAP